MLRHLVNRVCLVPKGKLIVAGAIGMLTSIEHLLANRPRKHVDRAGRRQAPAVSPQLPIVRNRERLFVIRRTKSELGYTFWVLQGFHSCKCFLLFDTWQEAMDEANLRLGVNQQAERLTLAAAASGKAC